MFVCAFLEVNQEEVTSSYVDGQLCYNVSGKQRVNLESSELDKV